jgi:hypothetical protein
MLRRFAFPPVELEGLGLGLGLGEQRSTSTGLASVTTRFSERKVSLPSSPFSLAIVNCFEK